MKKALLAVGFLALLGLGIVLAQPLTVLALNMVQTTKFEVRGNDLIMQGEINSKTLEQFEEIIAEHPQIERLIETNVPGSLDDETMIALAYRVRELGLDTMLLADSEIHSGGVDLFLAGVERNAERGAVIGVHSWSDGVNEATDYPRGAVEHEANRAYIEAMLGDDAFYWFTIEAAPAAGIHVVSEEEILKYGLLTGPWQ